MLWVRAGWVLNKNYSAVANSGSRTGFSAESSAVCYVMSCVNSVHGSVEAMV